MSWMVGDWEGLAARSARCGGGGGGGGGEGSRCESAWVKGVGGPHLDEAA